MNRDAKLLEKNRHENRHFTSNVFLAFLTLRYENDKSAFRFALLNLFQKKLAFNEGFEINRLGVERNLSKTRKIYKQPQSPAAVSPHPKSG